MYDQFRNQDFSARIVGADLIWKAIKHPSYSSTLKQAVEIYDLIYPAIFAAGQASAPEEIESLEFILAREQRLTDLIAEKLYVATARIAELEAAQKSVFKVVGQSALKHEGEDSYSRGMDMGAVKQIMATMGALEALFGSLPAPPKGSDI